MGKRNRSELEESDEIDNMQQGKFPDCDPNTKDVKPNIPEDKT